MQPSTTAKRTIDLSFVMITIALLAGSILTIVSWLKLCSVECSEGHKYRLMGFPFEVGGGAFFITAITTHILSRRYNFLSFITSLLVAAALGAELFFILLQKFKIGVWCPVCLAIASTVALTALILSIQYGNQLRKVFKIGDKGEIMKTTWKGISACVIFCLGFMLAFFGTSKFNPLQAAENSLKEKMAFGNQDSSVDMYIFTDWKCPACRAIEPELEKLVTSAGSLAKIYFVDLAVHPETMNFTPYNLSFMVNNKASYFKLRKMLENISLETGTPSQEQIESEMQKLGQKFVELNYADVDIGNKFYKKLERQYNVDRTPTVVIVNSEAKKGKKLTGGGEITQENVIKSINFLKSK